MKVVSVEWLDTSGEFGDMLPLEVAIDISRVYRTTTAGLLIDEDDERVVIAMEEACDGVKPPFYKHIVAVPKISIVSRSE